MAAPQKSTTFLIFGKGREFAWTSRNATHSLTALSNTSWLIDRTRHATTTRYVTCNPLQMNVVALEWMVCCCIKPRGRRRGRRIGNGKTRKTLDKESLWAWFAVQDRPYSLQRQANESSSLERHCRRYRNTR